MTDRLYLYGIFPQPAPDNLHLEGLDHQPVQTQLVDGFAFLYSKAQQERYLASRRNLLGHEKVLEQAMAAGYRTLLPLQFGLTIDGWEIVMQQLTTPHGQHLRQLFAKLDGQREVSVKVVWQADAELQALLAENQSLKAQRDAFAGKPLSMEEVVSIGEAIKQAMNERKQAIATAFRAALNPIATEVVENGTLTESMIYSAAYLISWDREPEVSAQVEALDRQFEGRLKIRYNDFTAPFNFAQIDPSKRMF